MKNDDFKSQLAKIRQSKDFRDPKSPGTTSTKNATTKPTKDTTADMGHASSALDNESTHKRKQQAQTPIAESFDQLLHEHGLTDTRPSKHTSDYHPAYLNDQQTKPTARPLHHPSDDDPVHKALAEGRFTAEMLTWGESMSYLKDGYPANYLKKLRRGQYRITFTVDLHGYYLKEATYEIHRRLNTAKANQHSTIRIIHGKGRHSTNKGPVIKSMLNHQLRLRDDVIAFATAPASDGGTGVLYCLMKI